MRFNSGKLVFIAFIIQLTAVSTMAGGENNFRAQDRPREGIWSADDEKETVVRNTEKALLSNNGKIIMQYFSNQVMISLRGSESGLFSVDQAYYIIQNYFNQHRIIDFKFSSFRLTGDMPYATGGGSSLFHGRREFLQIYMALTKVEKRWVIAQFNVY